MRITIPKFFKNNPQKGFTMMELLIIISLVGFLSGLGLTTGKNQLDKGFDSKRKGDLKKISEVMEHYNNDHGCYPTQDEWDAADCSSNPSFNSSYMNKFPCDPTRKTKYIYQTTDTSGNPCTGDCGDCPGYRLMAVLSNKYDTDIVQAGCDPQEGCGVTGPQGEIPNFGLAMGSSVPVPGFVPGQGENTGHTDTHDCQHSKDPGCESPTPTTTTTITSTPSPTPQIGEGCLPIPKQEPNPLPFTDKTYDTGMCSVSVDFQNLIYYENGLEWYKWEYGGYPDCHCPSWAETEKCIVSKISIYVPNLPPSNISPYIYKPYNLTGGKYQNYCLAAPYSGCPATNYACPLTGISNYNLYRNSRGEIIWRPNGNNISQDQKTANDNKRKQELNSIKAAFENYRNDKGYYPQVYYENSSSTIIRVRNQLEPIYLNPMPNDSSEHTYTITEWGKDANGKFTHYCVASYMDDSNNCANNCNSWVPFYNTYYCYGVGN